MSSMHRTLDGDVLIHHLTSDERMLDAELLLRHGRTGRTLVKEGSLRLTMMALAPNGLLPDHNADGRVTIQLLEGDATFVALGREYPMNAGDLLVLAPGINHAARSTMGCVFLLTIVHAGPHGEL